MHVNVRDILFQGVGYNEAFKISGERPDFENVKLVAPIEGEFTIARLETGILVRGRASSELELECHRCLRTFTKPMRVPFQQIFSDVPGEDEQPIADDIIDLAPVIEQEFLLGLPIKILHAPDCPGLGPEAEKYSGAPNTIKNTARIIKRNP